MQISWKKGEVLHGKRIQSAQDFFCTPKWPPYHCFEHQYGHRDVMWKLQVPKRDNASKKVTEKLNSRPIKLFDDHLGHHPPCKNLWSFSLFSSYYFPWLYCVDFSAASFISIFLCHSSSSEIQGQIVRARKSLNGRNLSLLFFAPYFSARLDFPSPPLSTPGSPRMVTREPVHRLLHRVWADNSISLTFSLLKVGQLRWSWREKILLSSERDSKIILLPCRLRYQENLKFLSFHVAVVHKRQIIWQWNIMYEQSLCFWHNLTQHWPQGRHEIYTWFNNIKV